MKIFTTSIMALFLLHAPGVSGEEILLSSFSTSIEDQDAGVKKNIFLALQKLNGYVILPGTVFSFNGIVGEGSARNGFVSGRVLYRDEVRYEPGGGLCQVSSTVYNAFLLAGFTIVERHRHYQPVTYVPNGLDATIKYGKKDLKMKNPHAQAVRIEAIMNDKSLIIILKGKAPLSYRYEIFTDEEDVQTPLLQEDVRVRKGISVYVYRKKYSGGRLIDNFLLYKDFYPAVFIK